MAEKYEIRPFGSDCMGNITGYVVDRYVWVPRERSARKDGLCLEREIGGQFVGNIYEPGSFDRARKLATMCADALNAAL